jgi:hypothetical protein
MLIQGCVTLHLGLEAVTAAVWGVMPQQIPPAGFWFLIQHSDLFPIIGSHLTPPESCLPEVVII